MNPIFKNYTNPIITSGEVPHVESKKKKNKPKKNKKNERMITTTTTSYNMEDPGFEMDDFWKIIDKFNWRNKDEQVINISSVSEQLQSKITNKTEFKNIFNELMDNLKNNINITHPDKKQIYSHVIGLGENFYNLVNAEPEILNFIINADLYQDLYTALF
jgi:hypothetical protein